MLSKNFHSRHVPFQHDIQCIIVKIENSATIHSGENNVSLDSLSLECRCSLIYLGRRFWVTHSPREQVSDDSKGKYGVFWLFSISPAPRDTSAYFRGVYRKATNSIWSPLRSLSLGAISFLQIERESCVQIKITSSWLPSITKWSPWVDRFCGLPLACVKSGGGASLIRSQVTTFCERDEREFTPSCVFADTS
jgi:hypothetical protein